MSDKLNQNSEKDLGKEINVIKSPWDEEEPMKNKSLVRLNKEDAEIEDLKNIAKGLAVGIAWSMSGLLDEKMSD
ncbi:MAG TPA: hypothetical protein V6D13_14585 [Halomicronema sp.]